MYYIYIVKGIIVKYSITLAGHITISLYIIFMLSELFTYVTVCSTHNESIEYPGIFKIDVVE